MKNIKTFQNFLNEDTLNEAADKWSLSSDGSPLMHRFSGKTFPQIMYSKESKKIFGRNDNGPYPSKTLETSDISAEGVKDILKGISTPHPLDSTIQEFLKRIK